MNGKKKRIPTMMGNEFNGPTQLAQVGDDGKLSGDLIPEGSSGGSWGSITGDLEDQTDLQNALDEKSNTSHNHSDTYEPANSNIQSHISNTSNPHSVTKAQVGLENVPNTDFTTKVGYIIDCSCSSTAPADEQTYYWGGFHALGMSILSGRNKKQIIKAGTITAAGVVFTQNIGSTETSSLYIRVNDTTDYLVSSAIENGSAANTLFYNTSLNISLSVGDFIEIKWVTPSWDTNPTGLKASADIYVET